MEANKKRLSSFPTTTNLVSKQRHSVGTDEGVWKPHPASPKGREGASPPAPLRMERGVNTTISKQRGRFFTSKRRPFHNDGTPSSIGEGRSFLFALSFFAKEAVPRYALTIHYFVRKQHYSRPSPFGEGTGVRLVVDGGEAACGRV